MSAVGETWENRVRVAACKIGQGVFAQKRFRMGELVGEVCGTIVHGEEHATAYCIELDEVRSLEPTAPFRFLNHSCSPNCEFYSWEDSPDQIWLQTLRSIAPGEELTIDYAWCADAAIPCLCGSRDCRGWVVNIDELEELRRREARRGRRKKVEVS